VTIITLVGEERNWWWLLC